MPPYRRSLCPPPLPSPILYEVPDRQSPIRVVEVVVVETPVVAVQVPRVVGVIPTRRPEVRGPYRRLLAGQACVITINDSVAPLHIIGLPLPHILLADNGLASAYTIIILANISVNICNQFIYLHLATQRELLLFNRLFCR